ncbi:MAG: hypothetical protein ABF274_01370 [Nonlabens sp.]|uniref:hypothetical protein n=1 Tax=Nonlabens sp. TaxID=1888209 RepID=UPI00321B88D9
MSIKNNSKQLLNGFLIFIGAIFLLYSLIFDDTNVYFKVLGLIMIMFGAYRASNHWVAHKDDHLSEEEE